MGPGALVDATASLQHPPAPSCKQTLVISGFVAPQREAGRVHWQGQSWAGVKLKTNGTLHPRESIIVMGRNGTTLQVMANVPVLGSESQNRARHAFDAGAH